MMKTEPDTLRGREDNFDVRDNIYLYSIVDIQMIYLLLVYVIKYVYIKTLTSVISAHKF